MYIGLQDVELDVSDLRETVRDEEDQNWLPESMVNDANNTVTQHTKMYA